MATQDPQPRKPAPLTSIQPAGGLGPTLLRLLGSPSPAWSRNVCPPEQLPSTSYLFTPHPLRLARAGLPEVVFFSALLPIPLGVCVLLSLEWCAWFWLPAGVLLVLWLFIVSIIRDPERRIPPDPL